MPEILAVAVTAVALFVIGSLYYVALGSQLATVSEVAAAGAEPAPWQMAVEVARCIVLAAVVAGLASQGAIEGVAGGLCLGLALWLGFPAVLWAGAISWERAPVKLAAIHAGDWLVKLPVAGVIVAVW